ncbi:flagellar filament capping protein FliD [Propionivibrio limicola]|uniref:flagellar filament capping protein FliD n=1 Tax=Propionivibrio limicola TaxID=167645 RepID=UPI0012924FC1|nr:flagellar filament capping protein FliD [Propionivibrio limicola]
MAGITATGTGSGIDIESLITKLMDAESTPLTKLDTKEATIESKISAVGQYKSLVYDLKAAGTALQDIENLNGITATVGNTDALAVVTENDAAVGRYSVEVKQLAQNQQIVSDAGTYTSASDALVESDSGVAKAVISVNFGSVIETEGVKSFSADSTRLQEITISAGSDGEITLQDVADAINDGDYGVTASLISDAEGSVRLAISGSKTGAENAFSIDVAYLDSAGESVTPATTPALSDLEFDPSQTTNTAFSLSENGTAQNSIMKLNGVEITRDSNTIDDAVEGMAFDLKEVTTSAMTVKIARDSSNISTQLQKFVDAYNALSSQIKTDTAYNATTGTAGKLQGEGSIRSLQSQFRSLLGQAFGDGSGSIRTLTDLGISFQDDGTLKLDSSKLKNAVNNNLDGVIEFIGAFDQSVSTSAPTASQDGFAYKLEQFSKNLLADGGLIDGKLDSLNNSIDDIDTQRERIKQRLEDIEARYRAKFTAMDTAVASLQSLSTYVEQLLEMTSSSS